MKPHEIEIIPAILPKSFEELESGLARLRGLAPFVQVDLVEKNILNGHEAFPLWEEFDFEGDIMLPNPKDEVKGLIDRDAAKIVVHAIAPTAREALEMLQDTRGGEYPIAAGVALASTDTPGALVPFEGLYDYVQVMGIEHIGSQGQPFDPRCLTLIKQLRTAYPELVVQVDGAVAPHIRALVEAGASRLIVGSAIMHADDPKKEIAALYTEANVGS